MMDIGSQLRQTREARGLSLEQVQKATRIKRVFLEAIEDNRFEELPGLVQARGFVRSYANHLGLDPDTLLVQFDSALGREVSTPLSRQTVTNGRPKSETPRAPTAYRSASAKPSPPESSLPIPLPILIVGALILFALGGFLIIRAFGGEAPAPTQTLPPSVPASANRIPERTATLPPTGEVALTLTSSEHVWVRVSQDGFTAFEGMLQPGEAQTWQAEQQVIVETGNGAALNVAVNGEDLGVLGPRNRVVVRAWGIEGEVTPAPTAIPHTPEPALESTATPTT
ncbi:MAG TPA: RodZ domain-containing protein [Anaerolineae bacterium]|nr:RodZ domain-containing protein [Anaerolineae bacterium]